MSNKCSIVRSTAARVEKFCSSLNCVGATDSSATNRHQLPGPVRELMLRRTATPTCGWPALPWGVTTPPLALFGTNVNLVVVKIAAERSPGSVLPVAASAAHAETQNSRTVPRGCGRAGGCWSGNCVSCGTRSQVTAQPLLANAVPDVSEESSVWEGSRAVNRNVYPRRSLASHARRCSKVSATICHACVESQPICTRRSRACDDLALGIQSTSPALSGHQQDPGRWIRCDAVASHSRQL